MYMYTQSLESEKIKAPIDPCMNNVDIGPNPLPTHKDFQDLPKPKAGGLSRWKSSALVNSARKF